MTNIKKHLNENNSRCELNDEELSQVAGGGSSIADVIKCKASMVSHCPHWSVDAIRAYCNAVAKGGSWSPTQCP